MRVSLMLFAFLTATFVVSREAAAAEQIKMVYLCGSTVEIQLATSGAILFADTGDGTTTEKMVDRIYAGALSAWLAGKNVTFFSPQVAQSWAPCISSGITAYRINILQLAN